MAKRAVHEGEHIVGFSLIDRTQHVALFVTLIVLTVTGLSLKFCSNCWNDAKLGA
jgi:cytochrome b subunit of formate dehydrogenase